MGSQCSVIILVFVKKDTVTRAIQDCYDNIAKLARRKDCKMLCGASSCVSADSYYIVRLCYIGTRLAHSIKLQNWIQRLNSIVLPLLLTDNCFTIVKLSFGRKGSAGVRETVEWAGAVTRLVIWCRKHNGAIPAEIN